MADLGVPAFQQTGSGLAAGDRGLAATGEGISAIASLIAEEVKGRKDDRLVDTLDSTLDEISDTAVSASAMSDTNMAVSASKPNPDLSSNGQQLLNNLHRNFDVANRASGATQTAAQTKGRAMVYHALQQARNNPQLRQRILNEFSDWVNFNPELQTLGLQDQQNQTQAKFAEDSIELMHDKSYGKIADGGFGMDPSIPFGSAAWAQEYSDKQKQENQWNLDQWEMRVIEESAAADIVDFLPRLNDKLGAAYTSVHGKIEPYFDLVQDVAQAQANIASDQATGEDYTLVAQWDAIGKDELLSNLYIEQSKLDLIRQRIRQSADLGGEIGSVVLARIDDVDNYIQDWINVAENVDTRPDLLELQKLQTTVRQRYWRDRNPKTESLAFDLENMKSIIDFVDVMDLSLTDFENDLGQIILHSVDEALATNRAYGDTWRRIRAGEDPADLLDRGTRERSTSTDVYNPLYYKGNPNDPSGRASGALVNIISSVKYRPLYNPNITKPDEPIIPEFFDAYNSEANNIEELRLGENYEATTIVELEKRFSSDIVTSQTIAARSRPLEDDQYAAIRSLGEALYRYNTSKYAVSQKLDISNRRKNIAALMDVSYGRVQLRDVIKWDLSELDNGKVSIVVAPDAGEQASENLAELGKDPRYGGLSVFSADTPEAYRTRINAAARDLEERVSRMLKYEANIAFIRSDGAARPNYIRTWDQSNDNNTSGGYNALFVERPTFESYTPPPPLAPSTTRPLPETRWTDLPETGEVTSSFAGYEEAN